MESGYLKSSPFGALTLAKMIQITLRILIMAIMGIPIIMNTRGMARNIYSNTDSWKLRAFLPFRLTHSDSSLRVNQQISGPITPPNGKKNPAKADK
jgi:hypothetical protein